ncbi:MAG TPA: SgcJ/EcaC family oxidoreductase [Terriglobales bacterium]|jgi:uncharacterized protein (TIGR02246 family)|nr:SgcJ/EcaC family oxidoreductase [Terriglobales bacterium]
MHHIRVSALVVAVLAVFTACNTASKSSTEVATAADTRAADEAAIRALDAEWVKAIATKDLDKATSYYAETAEMFAPNAPAASGKDAVQKLCASMLRMPGFALTFTPSKIEVARSGDIAYETGAYEMTVNDKKGKPQTVKAKYVVVWGKQADGSWKALVDSPTTTTL